MADASRDGEYELWEELNEQQDALGVFHPEMVHSLYENNPRVIIHPQMLCDFATIIKLAELTLEELGRKM